MVNANRGLRHLIHHSYSIERQRLDCEVFKKIDKSEFQKVEGGIVFFPYKLPAMRSLLELLLDRRNPDSPFQVCEVGFNMGHSSLFWLLQSPTVSVRAFDIGMHDYAHRASSYLSSRFGALRLSSGVIFGDSRETLPLHQLAVRRGELPPCDLVFIDGGHSFEVAKSDILNFRGAVSDDHILIVDDIDGDEVERAWNWALSDGIIEEIGEIFEDNFYVDARNSRSSLVYGVYRKAGSYDATGHSRI